MRQSVAVASAGPYANLHFAQKITIASRPPLIFYRPDALLAAQPTASKHWRQWTADFLIQYSVTSS